MKLIPAVCEDPDDGLYWPYIVEGFVDKINVVWKAEHAVATPSRAMEIAKAQRDRLESSG